MTKEHDSVREQVREGYKTIAKAGIFTVQNETDTGCCSTGGCCGNSDLDVNELVKSIGYNDSDLSAVPDTANMGLSCGNPTAIASLREGEVVLDLGSGGGFDAFVAGPKVGNNGKVIGVDMTAEMISKARAAIPVYSEHTGLSNVEFRLGEIENLPVADSSVDVIISNCVINLSPNKPRVWEEISRVLRPGGRVAISDLALLKPLPPEVMTMVAALVGCVAGASLVEDVERIAREAGLAEIKLLSKPEYIEAMTSWKDPLYQQILAALPPGSKASDYITSLDISAVKPVAARKCC
ncbi:MAG: arsenite methyltransferase [Bdellovibrionota bacterium]